MRSAAALAASVAVLAVASCSPPPPSAYVQHGAAPASELLAVGNNMANEPCSLRPAGAGGDVFCGDWTTQPSARIRVAEAATPADLDRLVAGSPWREEVEKRMSCGAARDAVVLGGKPARVMACTRRGSGFGATALGVLAGNRAFLADSMDAALPAMERAIGVLARQVTPAAAATLPTSGAVLLGGRTPAAAVSAGDMAQFDALTRQASDANRAGEPAVAAKAWSGIIALQRKGKADDAAIGASTMALAVQLSNQGRYADAQARFAEAESLVAGSSDTATQGRLLLYRGIDRLNQHQPSAALRLLDQAEASFALLTEDGATASRGAGRGQSASFALHDCDIDVQRCSALAGLVEARRNRAWALRLMGRAPESDAEATEAQRVAVQSHLMQAPLLSYVYRTGGISAAAAGEAAVAVDRLDDARTEFRRMPASRPLAETDLRTAEVEFGRGHDAGGLALCRQAIVLMKARHEGVDPALIEPCLDGMARAANGAQSASEEMFEAAQFGRGTVTANDFESVAVRLGAATGDPQVAGYLRRYNDSHAALVDLRAQRAALGPGTDAAELDRKVFDAEQEFGDAEADVYAHLPNFGELTQSVVSADGVLAELHPGEAFVSMLLGPRRGWVFLLRDGQATMGRIDGGRERIDALVWRFRAGAESPPLLPGAGAAPTATRFDTAAAYELFNAVLGPVDDRLADATALTVAPAGPLLSVPFSALLTEPTVGGMLDGAPWLLRRFPIAHTPSPATFVQLRKAGPSQAPRPWIGFGGFERATPAQAARTFGPGCGGSAQRFAGLGPLDGSRAELADAARATRSSAADEVTGPAFTAEAVRRMALSRYRFIHFAAHTVMPSEMACLDEPVIVTSTPVSAPDVRPALLTAAMVRANLKLDAELVVLSASTAGGPDGAAAESLSGLARSFLYAGARALLVTQWDTSDAVASAVVPVTLEQMAGHRMGPAAALRSVQLRLLDDPAVPAFAKHPHYWAPYTVIGEGGTAQPERTALQ